MKIEIINCTSFYYLVMSQSVEFKEIPIVKDFINCMNEYSELCDCNGGELKNHKLNQCEIKYRNIIISHLDEIKSQLLIYNEEFDFISSYPSETFLANIKREE